MTDLQYPIGRFPMDVEPDSSLRPGLIDGIASAPALLRAAVEDLNDQQLDTPYRPGGWTVRQVVHHIADSHMNGFIRFKLALTEDKPAIKPYDEAKWAELSDTKLEIDISLMLLKTVHQRWVDIIKHCQEDDFHRTFFHPEHKIYISLNKQVGLYEWHGRHHTAHITALRERNGWK